MSHRRALLVKNHEYGGRQYVPEDVIEGVRREKSANLTTEYLSIITRTRSYVVAKGTPEEIADAAQRLVAHLGWTVDAGFLDAAEGA